MARLLLLFLTIIGLVLMFTAKSAGLLGLGLLLGIVGFFGLVLALAAARVSASARPETSMASVEDIAAFRKRPTPTRPPVATPPTGNPVER
jgi:hypothetical protein